jgi:hypothetical protein
MVTSAAQKVLADLPETFLLAVRAYRRDTMGKPGLNDLNMFDDAFFIVTPDRMTTWNGNTDPTRYGWNPNADKYMARLKVGAYTFVPLVHRGKYAAFGQGPNPVTVERIDSTGKVRQTETGEFGINLHYASEFSTSSEGCLTVPRSDWSDFFKTLSPVIKKNGGSIRLLLTDGPIS